MCATNNNIEYIIREFYCEFRKYNTTYRLDMQIDRYFWKSTGISAPNTLYNVGYYKSLNDDVCCIKFFISRDDIENLQQLLNDNKSIVESYQIHYTEKNLCFITIIFTKEAWSILNRIFDLV